MFKLLCSLLLSASLTGFSAAQMSNSPQESPSSGQTPQNTRFAPGTKLRAELDKTVDAKKVNAGAPVLAKTMDDLRSGDQVVAPRGAKIVGHVVAANPHDKNTPSRLEIAFDKLQLPNGAEIPMKAEIDALAKPVSNTPMGNDNTGQNAGGGNAPMTSPGARGGAAPAGGMGQQPAGQPTSDTASMPAATTRNGGIAPNAQGVTGISGISLSAGPSQDTVLTSEKHNVKLDGGTQMILRTQ